MARAILSNRQARSFLCVAAASNNFSCSISLLFPAQSAFIGCERSGKTPIGSVERNTGATHKLTSVLSSPSLSSRYYSSIARTADVSGHSSLFSVPADEINRDCRNSGIPYQNRTIKNYARTTFNNTYKKSESSKKKVPKSYKKTRPGLFRADKVLSERASMSRSRAFSVIKSRRLTLQQNFQNHEGIIPPPITIKGPKEKISMNAELYLDGKTVPQQPPVLVAYHKPINVLSAMEEKHSTKKHLGLYLPNRFKKMHPVGRLDYDTSGLILFSRDGDLTHMLLHPKHAVERQYVATVMGKVDDDSLRARLKEGVETGEGTHYGNLLDVCHLDKDECVSFLKKSSVSEHIERSSTSASGDEEEDMVAMSCGEDVNFSHVRVAVQEGKHRMVRRMLANCQHPVVELKRERYGEVVLGELNIGEFRECTESEINWALNFKKKKRRNH